MGIKEILLKKSADGLMNDMKKAQKESVEFTKQLNNELHALAELINQSLDSQNEIIRGNVTIYKLLVSIAKKEGADIPEPMTDMEIS